MKIQHYITGALMIGLGMQGISCSSQRNLGAVKLGLDKEFVRTNLEDAHKQIAYLAASINESDMPTTYKDGKYVNWGSSWWALCCTAALGMRYA